MTLRWNGSTLSEVDWPEPFSGARMTRDFCEWVAWHINVQPDGEAPIDLILWGPRCGDLEEADASALIEALIEWRGRAAA